MEIAGCNYVANDKIWKDHVRNENVAEKLWQEKWGFMLKSVDELSLAGDEEVPPPKPEVNEPLHRTEPAVKPLAGVTVAPSPGDFPKTTNRTIGWRAQSKECALDKYNQKRRAKGCILKRLDWPLLGIV